VRVDKISISLNHQLAADVRAAAKRSGRGLSAWMAEAAADKLRGQSLDEFLNDWEAEHGAFTPEELAEAEAELHLTESANQQPAA
jgi:hypothetical protein